MKDETQKLNDQIADRYSLINKKTAFIKKAAEKLGNSPHTIRNHWVGGFWNTPEDSQEEFLELIEEEIKEQSIPAQ